MPEEKWLKFIFAKNFVFVKGYYSRQHIPHIQYILSKNVMIWVIFTDLFIKPTLEDILFTNKIYSLYLDKVRVKDLELYNNKGYIKTVRFHFQNHTQ